MGRSKGFTLMQLMIAVAIAGVLTAMAVSIYTRHVQSSMATAALSQLDRYGTRMQKAFQDNGNYGAGGCAVVVPTGVKQFEFSCELLSGGQEFVARAAGSTGMKGMTFSIDDQGRRRTEAFPGAADLPSSCWMVEKNKCL